MEIKEFTIVSQSRNGRKAMLVYKAKGGKSITRHVVRVMNGWEYKTMKKKVVEGNEVDVVDIHETFVTAGK